MAEMVSMLCITLCPGCSLWDLVRVTFQMLCPWSIYRDSLRFLLWSSMYVNRNADYSGGRNSYLITAHWESCDYYSLIALLKLRVSVSFLVLGNKKNTNCYQGALGTLVLLYLLKLWNKLRFWCHFPHVLSSVSCRWSTWQWKTSSSLSITTALATGSSWGCPSLARSTSAWRSQTDPDLLRYLRFSMFSLNIMHVMLECG